MLGPWRHGWGICMDWGLARKPLTTGSCPVVTVPIEPQGSPWLTANHRLLHLEWAQRWQNLTMGHWQHDIFSVESGFQLYLIDGRLMVCHLPGERFQQRCQAYRVQTSCGSAHVWGALHNGAKSPLVFPDRYLTSELYKSILRNNLVPFARQHFGDNYRYQDDNATPYPARVLLDFLQLGNVTKMEHPTWFRIVVSSAKPCWMNDQKSL